MLFLGFIIITIITLQILCIYIIASDFFLRFLCVQMCVSASVCVSCALSVALFPCLFHPILVYLGFFVNLLLLLLIIDLYSTEKERVWIWMSGEA